MIRLRRILGGSGSWVSWVLIAGVWAWAQEAAEETGAAETGGLTPWSAIVVLGTLVIVLGGILLYLAIERRRA